MFLHSIRNLKKYYPRLLEFYIQMELDLSFNNLRILFLRGRGVLLSCLWFIICWSNLKQKNNTIELLHWCLIILTLYSDEKWMIFTATPINTNSTQKNNICMWYIYMYILWWQSEVYKWVSNITLLLLIPILEIRNNSIYKSILMKMNFIWKYGTHDFLSIKT